MQNIADIALSGFSGTYHPVTIVSIILVDLKEAIHND